MASTFPNVISGSAGVIGEAASPPRSGVIVGGASILPKRIEYGMILGANLVGAGAGMWWLLTHRLTWIEVSAFLIGFAIINMGVGIGYHRYFTHRAFETSLPMRYVLGIMAQLACQSGIAKWAADHRRHHAHADAPGDLHSPYVDGLGRPYGRLKGLVVAHFGWLFDTTITDMTIYGRGLVGDPVVEFCGRTRWFWVLMSMIGFPALWGYAFGGWAHAVGAALVGGCLRTFILFNFVLAVNSIGHVFGSERFEGDHHAKNNWLLALLTFGDGWHNNHHEHPRLAKAGIHWWEIDVNGSVIHGLEKLGLVWNVQKMSPHTAAKVPAVPDRRAARIAAQAR